MIKFKIKTFQEFSAQELYDVLQLRSEVFVVEQDCVYQDLDGKDQKAWHILGYSDSNMVSYTRVFKPGDYFKESSIGRVVVAKKYRHNDLGFELMQTSINFILSEFKVDTIRISAQTYLLNFYNSLGFLKVGEEYLEDGIPHVNMIYSA